MVISVIGLDEKANQDDFIVRKLSQTSYNIEESNTLLEITNHNTILVTAAVIDHIGNNPPKAKIETKEYLYRTKDEKLLQFTVKDGQLHINPES